MHGDAPVDAPVSGAMGYLLTMLAQDVGFPVPKGGASALTAAMVRRTGAAETAMQQRGHSDRCRERSCTVGAHGLG